MLQTNGPQVKFLILLLVVIHQDLNMQRPKYKQRQGLAVVPLVLEKNLKKNLEVDVDKVDKDKVDVDNLVMDKVDKGKRQVLKSSIRRADGEDK